MNTGLPLDFPSTYLKNGMNKLFSLLALVFAIGLSTVALEADAAKRVGSGKSVGTQRATADKAPSNATQSTAAPAAAAAAPAAAAASKRSWMGPLAGLAAGLGLAALASHLGFGQEMASMLMMGLVAFAVIAAIGFFLRRRAANQQAGGMQPAHQSASPAAFKFEAPAKTEAAGTSSGPTGGSMIGAGIGSGAGAGAAVAGASAARIPLGFDVVAFERNAKVQFIRLQAANDAGNVEDIREFTSPEMFAELKMDIASRPASTEKSDVVTIHADLVEVVEEAQQYVASIRFSGFIRYDQGSPDESFDEMWHLTKSRQGGGWVLSGIQQMS